MAKVRIVKVPVEMEVTVDKPYYNIGMEETEAQLLFAILCSCIGKGKYNKLLSQMRADLGPKLPTSSGITAPGIEGMLELG